MSIYNLCLFKKLFDINHIEGATAAERSQRVNEVRAQEIEKADVILTTCTFSASPDIKSISNFEGIVIDEACQVIKPVLSGWYDLRNNSQAGEAETLIPLGNRCNRIILVADNCQVMARCVVNNFYSKYLLAWANWLHQWLSKVSVWKIGRRGHSSCHPAEDTVSLSPRNISISKWLLL